LRNVPSKGLNDPDMIIAGTTSGNNLLSENIAKLQMSLWAIFQAPLLLSSDLRNVTDNYVKIIKNKRCIEVNQDKLRIKGGLEKENVYTRQIENGLAIAFTNLTDNKVDETESFSIEIPAGKEISTCINVWGEFPNNMCEDLDQLDFENILWRIHKNSESNTLEIVAKNIEGRSVNFMTVKFVDKKAERFMVRAEDI